METNTTFQTLLCDRSFPMLCREKLKLKNYLTIKHKDLLRFTFNYKISESNPKLKMFIMKHPPLRDFLDI